MWWKGNEKGREGWDHRGGLTRKAHGEARRKGKSDPPEVAGFRQAEGWMSRGILTPLGRRLCLGLQALSAFRLRLSPGMHDGEEGRYELCPSCCEWCVHLMVVPGSCGAVICQKMINRWIVLFIYFIYLTDCSRMWFQQLLNKKVANNCCCSFCIVSFAHKILLICLSIVSDYRLWRLRLEACVGPF